MAVLEVEGLEVAFGPNKIIRGVSFELEAGHTLGVVGESGCGKSMTGFAIMNMLPGTGKIVAGSIRLEGEELTTLSRRQWLDVRGEQIALVMQDPFTSLNPMMRIGHQVAEVLRIHHGLSRAIAWTQAIDMLEKVGVPAPESSAKKYPHQLSGGQRQRVVIAMAFACKPKVLIADEPTTALDVTLQAQILRLLRELKETEGTAVMLISHDIGVIAAMASRIAVFYAGKIVEHGDAEQVLRTPQHPYTSALLSALPRAGQKTLESIIGQPPDLANLSAGCSFAPRCPFRFDHCQNDPPLLASPSGQNAACWKLESGYVAQS
ncbi:MAG: ABC transporter ATP-binding protein [Fimbriimonadaceae bacterium]|nr:ABC transporter ATP-binding protein [Fimbriimonadaceae bacterium]